MPIPQAVIVGRPNVGKSSLFNWLAGKRLAIVDPTAGVTRDRLAHLLHENDRFFEIVDTGGMGIKDIDNLTQHIEQQIATAIDLASVVLFVVDARDGVTPLDVEVAERLRHVDKPLILVANKADNTSFDPQAAEFFKLGFGEPILVSTLQNRNRAELLQAIVERLPNDAGDGPPDEPEMKLAIVGRRNTGKSTFVNTLAQSERVIVSEVAGTTRRQCGRARTSSTGKPLSLSIRRASDAPKAFRPTSTFIACTVHNEAFAEPTWCCCSSTRCTPSARWTNSLLNTSHKSTGHASSL